MKARRMLLGAAAQPVDYPAKRGVAGIRWGQVLLAAAMIGLGIRGFIVGDFASVWQRIPVDHLPTRQFLVYGCAAIELATGIGLLWQRAIGLASMVLLAFLLLWATLLKLPAVTASPLMEATWLGFGEITVVAAGAWVVAATHANAWARRKLTFVVGANGVRCSRFLFAVSLPMIGLSHFVYAKETVALIPAWLPWHLGWAYLTGAASIAASLGVMFAFWPRLAATLEAAMLSVITLLVWLPGLIAAPSNDSCIPFLMSAAIACGAWAVADSYRGLRLGDGGVSISQHALRSEDHFR